MSPIAWTRTLIWSPPSIGINFTTHLISRHRLSHHNISTRLSNVYKLLGVIVNTSRYRSCTWIDERLRTYHYMVTRHILFKQFKICQRPKCFNMIYLNIKLDHWHINVTFERKTFNFTILKNTKNCHDICK